MTFLKRAPSLTLREWKRNEKKVEGKYCWAITRAALGSCCSSSGFCFLEFGFQLESLQLTLCVLNSDLWKIRLAPDASECNYCTVRRVSVGPSVYQYLFIKIKYNTRSLFYLTNIVCFFTPLLQDARWRPQSRLGLYAKRADEKWQTVMVK